MPRLIAVDVVPNVVVVVGIWMLLSLVATTVPPMVHASSTVAASDGQLDACPRLCSCLGNVIDCSEKSLQALFPIPLWVDNL